MQKGFSNVIILAVLAIAFGALLVNLISTASQTVFVQNSALAGYDNPKEKIGSITLVEQNPKLGAKVTFKATAPVVAKAAKIQVNCYQNNTFVWGESKFLDGSFVLGGTNSLWTSAGGSADCNAYLFERSENVFVHLAGVSFHAGGK